MKGSREGPHSARHGWQLLGLVASCFLFYWILIRGYSASEREAETIRRQFHPAGRTASSGHSPFALPAVLLDTPVDRQIENLEPGHAGWDSEVVSASIGKQLDRLRQKLESSSHGEDIDYSEIAADRFAGVVLPRNALQIVFDVGKCQTLRLPDGYADFHATDSFSSQINSLVDGQAGLGNLRCSFKVTHIDPQQDAATTRVLFEWVRTTDAAVQQANAVIQCAWTLATAVPRIKELGILEYEQVCLSATGKPMFDDVTAAVFEHGSDDDREAFEEQVLRGIEHWSERLSAIDDMSIYGHHGLAISDVNQDGLDDMYVCDAGGLPNRLYLQSPDGTLVDVSRPSNADWLESTSSALLIDLDNDGDADLVAATVAGMIVAANDGAGVFTIRAVHADMPEAQSLCAADYDNDGDLDLYVTNYGAGGSPEQQRGFEASPPIPYNDANNGGRNILFQNQGGFQFVDITSQCGLDENNRRFSFAASWEDFDVDGDMDLYVANDFGRNNLYRNDRGMFHDVAAELSVEDMAGGMSVSWGDANQDGLMDIYVGNMYSAAGNRVTYQRQFLSGRAAESSAGIQRMARGNTLFIGQPNGPFIDVSQAAGVLMGRWAWGSKFVDLNNDGREDLVVANGYMSNAVPDDL